MRNNLGQYLMESGRRRAAIEELNQALARKRTLLGPDDPSTLDTLCTLAEAYQADGQCGRAEDLFRELWDQSARVHGADHRQTGLYVTYLASCLLAAESWDQAEQVLLEARNRFALGSEALLRRFINLQLALYRQMQLPEQLERIQSEWDAMNQR